MEPSRSLPPRVRILISKLGTLLLLFQRLPLVKYLLPETRLLASSGAGDIVGWTVASIAGLGGFDTVAGATEVSQISPARNALVVPGAVGSNLVFVYQVTGTPNVAASWSVSDPLPPGLTHPIVKYSSVDSISGVPTQAGSYPVTVTAWQYSTFSGGSWSEDYTIVIGPPVIATQPSSTLVASGGSATLSATGALANGTALSYQWYQGNSPATTTPITGATAATYRTPALTSSTNYWVRVTRTVNGVAVNANSVTAIATVGSPPAIANHPVSVTVDRGKSASLSVEISGTGVSVQWYRGESGDLSEPVAEAVQASFTTPALTESASYWARASNALGTADSDAARITVAEPDLFGLWQESVFNEEQRADPAVSGPDADPDGDGIHNSDEYLLGTSPWSLESILAPPAWPERGRMTVDFAARRAQGTGYEGLNRHYALERAIGNLDAGNWAKVPGYEDVPGNDQTISLSISPGATPVFYRLRVWLTP